jgi:hypothetical protein
MHRTPATALAEKRRRIRQYDRPIRAVSIPKAIFTRASGVRA